MGQRDGSEYGSRSYDSPSELEVFFENTVATIHDSCKRRIASTRKAHTLTKTVYKKCGKIGFTIKYNESKKNLEIHILKAIGIAPKRDVSDINPFVRLYLLPGKKQKRSTKYQKQTKDPYINEEIIMSDLGKEELANHKLKLKLYNHVLLKKKELLGEVDVDLSCIDISVKQSFIVDLFRKKLGVSSSFYEGAFALFIDASLYCNSLLYVFGV